MKKVHFLVPLSVAGVIILAACGDNKETPLQPFNIASAEKANQVVCEQAEEIRGRVGAIKDIQDPRHKSAELQAWGFDPNPNNTEQLNPVMLALDLRIEGCKQVSPSSSSAPAAPCPNGFTVKLDPNYDNNIYSGGVSEIPKEAQQQIAQGSKEDPRKLQNVYNASPLGKQDPIENAADIAPLTDGACYTEQGVKWYSDWLVLWRVVDLRPDALPATGVNTGATPGGNGFQDQGAIAPSPGLRATYPDANGNPAADHWIRVRCGQVVSAGPVPGLPPKPPTTTTTPPRTTTTTPPTTTTRGGKDVENANSVNKPNHGGAAPPQGDPLGPPAGGTPSPTNNPPAPPTPPTTPRPAPTSGQPPVITVDPEPTHTSAPPPTDW